MKMNILIEGGDLNPPFKEGTRNIVRTYVKELSKRHRVVILTRRKEIIMKKNHKKIEIIEGIKYYRWANYFDLFFLLPKIIRKEKINVVHTFAKGLRSSYYLTFIKRFLKKKVILTLLGFPESSKNYKNEIKKLIKSLDLLTISSETLFNEIRFISKNRIRYVPYGMDTEKFNFFGRRDKKTKNLLCLKVPSISLLKAFKRINEEFGKKYKTYLLLDKLYFEEKNYINKEVISFIKKENIKNLILLGHEDIPKLLNKVEILIEPHPGNKFLDCASPPLLMLEAMSCKVKVVSTDIPEIKEVIENKKNGFLTRNNDEYSIYDGIKKALLSKKSIGENARRTILEKYDIKKIVPKYEEIYFSLINKKK